MNQHDVSGPKRSRCTVAHSHLSPILTAITSSISPQTTTAPSSPTLTPKPTAQPTIPAPTPRPTGLTTPISTAGPTLDAAATIVPVARTRHVVVMLTHRIHAFIIVKIQDVDKYLQDDNTAEYMFLYQFAHDQSKHDDLLKKIRGSTKRKVTAVDINPFFWQYPEGFDAKAEKPTFVKRGSWNYQQV